jgi:hypothetical protein
MKKIHVLCVTKAKKMKSYTQIRGEVKEVKILNANPTNPNILKVEAWDFTDGRLEAFRVKSEVFTSLTKAKKYFK